jgi:acetoin utilization protein AcuB
MITSVKKIMTQNLITVPMGTNLFEASELMKEKRIRHLPVVDSNDDLVGIISQRDLHYVPDSKNLAVELMMSAPVHFVSENTPLRRAIFLMLQLKISCLLISDASDNAVGIITTDDLLWHLSHLLADEEDEHSRVSYQTQQTIGEVAKELAQIGI